MPALLANLSQVLQDVTALNWVPSALAAAEETLCKPHCPDWAERTMQHLVFHLLYLGLNRTSTESLHQLVLRGYRGQLLAAGVWGPLLPWQGPFQHSIQGVGPGYHQWKYLDKKEGVADSLQEEHAEVLLCRRGLLPLQTWACLPSQMVGLYSSLALQTPISMGKLPNSWINQFSVAFWLPVLGTVYIWTLICTYSLVFVPRFIITIVGAPSVTSCIPNMLGMCLFVFVLLWF